jgi:hypothetical protein
MWAFLGTHDVSVQSSTRANEAFSRCARSPRFAIARYRSTET